MLSLLTMEAALEPLLEAGMDALRAKSILMTDYASFLTENCSPLWAFPSAPQRDSARRGSHISIRHAEGYRINRALIEEMNVIPDFREPDNIRLGFAPLYISFADIWEGFDRIRKGDGRKALREISEAKIDSDIMAVVIVKKKRKYGI